MVMARIEHLEKTGVSGLGGAWEWEMAEEVGNGQRMLRGGCGGMRNGGRWTRDVGFRGGASSVTCWCGRERSVVRMRAQGVGEGDGCNMRRGRVVPVCGDGGQHQRHR